MARRSLKPQLNQIRTWVRQGRTDAWIAHQLEVTVQQVASFKREHDLADGADAEPGTTPAQPEDLDLRAEDDALIAAELEAEAARRAEEEAAAAAAAEEDVEVVADEDDAEADGDEGAGDAPKPRRRGRRGGRGRARKGPAVLEGTFDHGEEGYGLWLDPAVADDPVYAEHWSGSRDVTVTVEADRIVIRRAGDTGSGED